jgi:general secretion pathway protein F
MRFLVKTFDPARGTTGKAVVEAEAEAQACERCEADGLVPLSVRRAEAATPAFTAATRTDVRLLCKELSTLLAAGLNVVEAVDALASRESDERIRHVYARLATLLRQGQSFAGAVNAMTDAFPPLFRAAMQASDVTADVGPTLERFARFDEAMAALRTRLISSAIYPLVVVGFGLLVILFLLGYVVPRFASVYTDVATSMSTATRIVLAAGTLVDRMSGVIAVAFAGVGVMLFLGWRRGWITAGVLTLVQRIGWTQRLWRHYELSRLFRSMSLLLGGGYAVPRAMAVAEGVLLTHELKASMRQAAQLVTQGAPLSTALADAGIANAVDLRLVRAGERSATLPKILDTLGDVHHDAFSVRVERAARLAEPLLLMLVGGAIGGIVLLMYLPIFDLTGAVR